MDDPSTDVSKSDRVCKDVLPPITTPLEDLWVGDKKDKVNIDALREHFKREGRLKKEDVLKLLELVSDIFAAEPNLLDVPAPVTVCGDVHGQFYDLLKLFEVGGDPAETSYLFMGDYVDRGYFSFETLIFLYAHKINYKKTFFMLRGNHECRHLTDYFTFKEECEYKYDEEVYDFCCDSFDTLPISAIMNEQFLCVHGGLGPEIETLDDIKDIDRFREPPQEGPLCDLLWADPLETYDDDEEENVTFIRNHTRGCSFMYGYQAVTEFLERNNLLCMLRAHEAQDNGYLMMKANPATGFPTVITLFSAPNYLDAYGNKGAVLRYEDTTVNIRQFNHSDHPYYLPNFMNVLTWSLPFVAEKVAEMLLVILKLVDDAAIEEKETEAKEAAKATIDPERAEIIKKKIMAASKMVTMMKTLRTEHETIMQLKAVTPGNQIPKGLLSQGADAIHATLGKFQEVKEMDAVNERVPETPKPKVATGKTRISSSGRVRVLRRGESVGKMDQHALPGLSFTESR